MARPLGLSSIMLQNRLTDESLGAARDRGFSCVEVSIPVDDPLQTDDGAVRDVREAIERAGLYTWSIHAPFGGPADLSHPDELAWRDAVGLVSRACEVGAELGARYAVIHAGLLGEDEAESELRRRQSIRSINYLLKRCSQLGIRLAIEYLPANKPRLGNDAEQILQCLRISDGEACVCLDTNHANLRRPLADEMRALGDRVETLHISDNDGVQERHLMPGEGVIDWPEFLELLDEISYDGPLMIEAHGGETIEECLTLAATAAQKHLGWEGPDA